MNPTILNCCTINYGIFGSLVFKDASYDEATRTFTGTVSYHSGHTLAQNGACASSYELIFSEDFSYIEPSSKKNDYDEDGKLLRTENLEYNNGPLFTKLEKDDNKIHG